jgi:hypothetical protein
MSTVAPPNPCSVARRFRPWARRRWWETTVPLQALRASWLGHICKAWETPACRLSYQSDAIRYQPVRTLDKLLHSHRPPKRARVRRDRQISGLCLRQLCSDPDLFKRGDGTTSPPESFAEAFPDRIRNFATSISSPSRRKASIGREAVDRPDRIGALLPTDGGQGFVRDGNDSHLSEEFSGRPPHRGAPQAGDHSCAPRQSSPSKVCLNFLRSVVAARITCLSHARRGTSNACWNAGTRAQP